MEITLKHYPLKTDTLLDILSKTNEKNTGNIYILMITYT